MLFDKARLRLALFFAIVVAVILVLIGVAVLSAARASLFDGVNDDLEGRSKGTPVLADALRTGTLPKDVALLRGLTAGGYFYAFVRPDGSVLRMSENVDDEGLPGAEAVADALAGGPVFVDTKSSDGEDLRVLVQPIPGPAQRPLVMEIGRSTEPERQALRRLRFILFGGGIVGLAMSIGAGYWLAGRALQPIKTAMDKQQEFVADASHELRTPLSLIRANAEILKREADSPVSANLESVQDIINETDRLANLVGQMLTLAKADTGQTPIAMEPVDLAVLAKDTAREMGLLADENDIAIEAHTNGPAIVEGDELRLRELLTILIDNSLKYSDPGGHVDVSVRGIGGKALIEVRDNGRGIPREALPRIFERFYRADKARSRELGGAGLGLAIAKWTAETHKGSIRIDSEMGRGTTVTVELPLVSA
jgi:signal transduction histidine kinase